MVKKIFGIKFRNKNAFKSIEALGFIYDESNFITSVRWAVIHTKIEKSLVEKNNNGIEFPFFAYLIRKINYKYV